MSTDLERRIASLVQQWDESVAPIVWDELRGRASGLGPEPVVPSPDEAAVPVVPQVEPVSPAVPFAPARRPRVARSVGVVAGLAAAALVVTLVVVIAHGDGDPSAPSDTVPPTTIVEPTTLPEPTATTLGTSSLPGATVLSLPTVTLSEDESTARMAAIEAERAQLFATFHSFRATVTVATRVRSDVIGPEPMTTAEHSTVLTMRADGSLWAESADGTGDVNTFDATTGTARVWALDDDGTAHVSEVGGQEQNTLPLLIGVGFDPTRLVLGHPSSVEEVTSHLGRPAWLLTLHSDGVVAADAAASSDAFDAQVLVDRTSGLVISSVDVRHDPSGRDDITEVLVDDLELDVPLPAAWPASFPADADVEHQGDPDTFSSPTLDEAIAEFGVPVAVPTDRTIDAITMTRSSWESDGSGATDLTLTIRSFDGFAVSSIVFWRTVPAPGGPVPDGYAEVAGSWCYSRDGLTCEHAGGGTTIDTGAYAGLEAGVGDGQVDLQVGGVAVTVTAMTTDDALAFVRSLQIVGA